ncbi:MAG: hypothetical protein MUF18_06005 [Fimbriiglobus sp.]|nr:hypothetical protein [Fimbriiglobus sp.]
MTLSVSGAGSAGVAVEAASPVAAGAVAQAAVVSAEVVPVGGVWVAVEVGSAVAVVAWAAAG